MRNMRRYMHTLDRLAWVVQTERQHLGWSQDELAARANVPTTAVVGLEQSLPVANLATTKRVLDALGVEILVLPAELAAVK